MSLIRIIDSLKYVDENDGRKLAWLPRELPPNVKIIVSTLPDDHYECFNQLKRIIHPECFIEVTIKKQPFIGVIKLFTD